MLRATLVLALACLLPGTALAETVVSLMVGGSEVRVAVADDFVRLSEKLPTVFALEAAAQPKTNHLLEGFISLADAKRIALGGVHEQPLLEVATMRNVEALDFSAADWAQARPMIARAIGQVDLKAAVVGGQASADQRLSDTVGSTVAVHFGQVGQPVFYGNDPDSVRFVLLVSATVVANGATTPYQVENAGAIVRLGSKLMLMYASRRHADGDDTSAVRSALDAFVDRALALNASAAAQGGHCQGQEGADPDDAAGSSRIDPSCAETPAAAGANRQ